MREVCVDRVYGDVETKETEFQYFNLLGVSAGTDGRENNICGDNDAGTYFRLDNFGSTGWSISVHARDSVDEYFLPDSVEIHLVGASESVSFCEALEFAAQTLRQQLKDNAAE
jgi:hypothetical protein